MLNIDPASSAPPPPPLADDALFDPEVERARRYIAACRTCGLVIVPWRAGRRDGDRGMVLICGQETDGRNDFSNGTDRLLLHPDGQAAKGCRRGLVFELLCEELGFETDDPGLCNKVNEMMRAIYGRAS